MKHRCSCGEIVEAEGEGLLVATCINCGSYYIYQNEIVDPNLIVEEAEEEVVEKPKPRPAKRR